MRRMTPAIIRSLLLSFEVLPPMTKNDLAVRCMRAFVPQFLARLKALFDGAQNYFRHVAFRFFR